MLPFLLPWIQVIKKLTLPIRSRFLVILALSLLKLDLLSLNLELDFF